MDAAPLKLVIMVAGGLLVLGVVAAGFDPYEIALSSPTRSFAGF